MSYEILSDDQTDATSRELGKIELKVVMAPRDMMALKVERTRLGSGLVYHRGREYNP